MASPSSATVMFRALVMLACLVAIPLAAVFGRSLPEMLKMLLARRWPIRQAAVPDPSGEASGDLGEAARFQAMTPPTGGSPAPPQEVGSDWNARPMQPMPAGPGQTVDRALSAVIPAGYESVVRAAGAGGLAPASGTAAQTGSGDAPFQQIQDRLRHLGATHYRLEFWGNRQQLYHFCCDVAVGADPNYAHHFQATAANRLEAMLQVLDEVEDWRGGPR